MQLSMIPKSRWIRLLIGVLVFSLLGITIIINKDIPDLASNFRNSLDAVRSLKLLESLRPDSVMEVTKYYHTEICQELENLIQLIISEQTIGASMDKHQKYLVYNSIVVTDPLIYMTARPDNNINSVEGEKPLLSLTTHISSQINNMLEFAKLYQSWNGPISLGIFVSKVSDIPRVATFVKILTSCQSTNIQKIHPIRISLVIPNSINEESQTYNFAGRDCRPDWWANLRTSCSNSPSLISFLSDALGTDHPTESIPTGITYPQNLMRNTAILNARTEYIFNVDCDLILPNLLYTNLTGILGTHTNLTVPRNRIVLVIPVYEISDSLIDHDSSPLPQSKDGLLRLRADKMARMYHVNIFQDAHLPTNYPLWENQNLDEPFNISYEIKYSNFYEPFYVVHHKAPLFEENFVGYGMTRNSQVMEMWAAGYKFYALNHAFCMHPHFEEFGKRPKWKIDPTSQNVRRFITFRKILEARYGKKIVVSQNFENLLKEREREQDPLIAWHSSE